VRPSASTACWAAGDGEPELAVERSIGPLSILEGAVSWSSSENAARKEAERSVANLKRRHPEARTLGRSSQSSGGEAVAARRAERGECCKVGRSGNQKRGRARGISPRARGTSSTAAPPVSPSRGPVKTASSRSRDQWRTDEARPTVCNTPNALLALGQSDRTARQPSRQKTQSGRAQLIVDEALITISNTKKRSPTSAVCPTYRR